MAKVPYSLDKRSWSPSLIPGPITLVSTLDRQGEPNVAPKSWVQMVAFAPPHLMFSGTAGGTTETNILATGCFAVNLVDGRLAERAFRCIRWQGRERIQRSGFQMVPAAAIAVPLVDDSPAHLECKLTDTKQIGSGFVVFGEIIAASIDENILSAVDLARYDRLDQALFLEDGVYATVDRPHCAHAERTEDPEDSRRFVILLSYARPERFSEQLVRAHVAHLKRLEDSGRLEICGPFPDHQGGMVMLRNVTDAEAKAIAEADPFVISGAESYEIRKLEVSCRSNNHLGMG